MRQVAGVLIGHHGVHRPMLAIQLDAREELRDIAHQRWRTRAPLRHTRGSSSSSSPYSFSVDPQPAALVMMASKPPAEDGVDIAAGQLAGLVAHAGMQVQRAAAALALRAPPLRSRCSAARAPWLRSAARNATLAMQPARNATRWRRSPSGGKRAADLAEEERRLGGGRQLLQIAQPAQQFQLSPCRAPAP